MDSSWPVSWVCSFRCMIPVYLCTAWVLTVIVCSQVGTFPFPSSYQITSQFSMSRLTTAEHGKAENTVMWEWDWQQKHSTFSGEIMYVSWIYRETCSHWINWVLVLSTSSGMKPGDSCSRNRAFSLKGAGPCSKSLTELFSNASLS